MNWTYEIASVLGSAPWEDGMTKAELIEFAERNGASRSLLEDLKELEDTDDGFYDLEDLGIEVPTSDYEFGWNGDEY